MAWPTFGNVLHGATVVRISEGLKVWVEIVLRLMTCLWPDIKKGNEALKRITAAFGWVVRT